MSQKDVTPAKIREPEAGLANQNMNMIQSKINNLVIPVENIKVPEPPKKITHH
jgi:hypothetical protein